ncbi:MAG: hypothetical protein ACR2J8_04175 [Thermomicrobiales bacterium]
MMDQSVTVAAFMRSKRAVAIAALWGVAEATVFFIVPDVWIWLMAAFDPRAGLRGVIVAVAGAMAGGTAIYRAGGRIDPERSAALLDRVPAISPAMIAKVERQMAEHGSASMAVGPLQGTPYKIYARTAGMQRQSFPVFLLWTIPARGVRFLLIAAASALFGGFVRRRTRRSGWVVWPYAVAWMVFYWWYFRRVPG